MDGYRFQLRCRGCGGYCAHVTGGQASHYDARAIVRCWVCGRSWVVIVQLLEADDSHRGHAVTDAKLDSAANARAARRWERA